MKSEDSNTLKNYCILHFSLFVLHTSLFMKQLRTRLWKRFRKATSDYGLLADGDKILIGLSGGKDSLLLLELMAQQARIFKPAIKIEACHIRMENVMYESDTRYLKQFCDKWQVPLHNILTTRFDDNADGGKPMCFLCSWHRRKALFGKAQELGCNKIALGHHQDDIITTSLMNLFFQGRFDSTPPLYRMDKMPLTIIRPLCLEHEDDIRAYADIAGYEKQIKICPYENCSQRYFANKIFREAETENPEVRHSIWRAVQREKK